MTGGTYFPLSGSAGTGRFLPTAQPVRRAVECPSQVRLRLPSLIASHEGGKSCVCDISPAFDLSQPTISHHLKVLREAGLLDCERRGTWVYYRVIPSALAQLSVVFSAEAGTLPGSDCAPAGEAVESAR